LEFLEPFIAIGDSHRAYSAQCEFNPQKPAFGCKQLSGRLLLSMYQKSPYMPPIRLRRRNALVQRVAKSTRKIAIGDSLHACSALSELNPQKPAFGCRQLSGWLLLSRYQKTGAHVAGF